MVEIRRGSDGLAGPASAGGDRLPWLEPVEDEDDGDYGAPGHEPGGGYGGVMLAALVVLIAIAAITAGVVWIRHHRAANADVGEIIHPDPGPYKVKPAVPGGLNTDATGQVAAGTSAGQDIDSVLDLNAVPEQPVATRAKPGDVAAKSRPQPQSPPAPVAAAPPPAAKPPPVAKPAPAPPPVAVAKPAAVAKAPPAAKPSPVARPVEKPETTERAPSSGSTIQLGAFSTEAKAKAVWKSLAGRFHYLQDMTPVVLPVESGDTKLFRLRATGGATSAGQLCGQLRIAGETCAVVGQ